MVGVWLEVGLSADSKMVTNTLITVAVVLGFGNLNEFTIVLQVWHWNVFWVALRNVWWQCGDIIQSLAFSRNGVFHGLENGITLLMLGQLIVLAVNQILSECVDLQLADNSLQLIGLLIGNRFIHNQRFDGSILQLNGKWLLCQRHCLEVKLLLWNVRIPTAGHIVVNLSILGA